MNSKIIDSFVAKTDDYKSLLENEKYKSQYLIEAVDEDNIDVVKYLLQRDDVDVNVIDAEGNTALFYAKSIDVIKALVDAGIDVNRVDKFGNAAPLFGKNNDTIKALIKNNPEIAKLLLKFCFNFNIQDRFQYTMLT